MKKNIIKYISLLITLVLMVTFVSCKKKEQPVEESTDEPSESSFVETSNDDNSGEENSEEQKQDSSTKKPTGNVGGEDYEGNPTNPTDATPEQNQNGNDEQPKAKETVNITFQEGMSLTQIFKRMADNNVASFDDLMSTAQNYNYDYYPLIGAQQANSHRAFKLEGYLFPETYTFYTNMKPEDAIGKFLRVGKTRVGPKAMARADEMGYSIEQIITVASIVQREGSNPAQVKKVAGVIYNRLKAGQKLEMDSTITYIERDVKPYISGDINRYNSYYNTYKCGKLPSGPICNPGLNTIDAALYPEDSNYYYFCHDTSGNYYYAETYEEHQKNLVAAGLA